MVVTTYVEWLTEQKRGKNPSSLDDYLHKGGSSEGWNSEFKTAASQVDFGLREAVAALANARGGEVFVGVDDTGHVLGTTVKEQAMNDILRQPDIHPEPWFVSNLIDVVRQTVTVPFTSGDRWAYVLEVRERERPVFVLAKDGKRVLPVRNGSDTLSLDSLGSVEWYKENSRGTILRECYQELSVYMGQLSVFRRLPDGLPDRLPYLTRVMQDGSMLRMLQQEDIAALIGKGGQGARQAGASDLYYKVLDRVNRFLSWRPVFSGYARLGDLPGLRVEFSDLDHEVQLRLEELATYIRSQGFRV